MNMVVVNFAEQFKGWPETGRHILAQFDEQTILVYQAYRPSIGRFAAEHGYFGGDFKYGRMSWIKPSFLWMMYRCRWATAEGQETVLALRLHRTFFDSLLGRAVASTCHQERFGSQEAWRRALDQSDVRLQWDPDHTPTGEPCQRRAIQLGLRGQALEDYGKREIIEVIDVTGFVASQRRNAGSWRETGLLTPDERIYLPANLEVRRAIGLSA